MKHKEKWDFDEHYQIHEYYELDGKPGWTEEGFVTADTPEEMKEILQRMIADIDKHGVKDFD